jgi:hypothetical protein
MDTGDISKHFEGTTTAVAAADQALLDRALASAEWRRVGVLQRLTPTDRRETRFPRRSLAGAPLADAASS